MVPMFRLVRCSNQTYNTFIVGQNKLRHLARYPLLCTDRSTLYMYRYIYTLVYTSVGDRHAARRYRNIIQWDFNIPDHVCGTVGPISWRRRSSTEVWTRLSHVKGRGDRLHKPLEGSCQTLVLDQPGRGGYDAKCGMSAWPRHLTARIITSAL
jgi:hypothetical protein